MISEIGVAVHSNPYFFVQPRKTCSSIHAKQTNNFSRKTCNCAVKRNRFVETNNTFTQRAVDTQASYRDHFICLTHITHHLPRPSCLLRVKGTTPKILLNWYSRNLDFLPSNQLPRRDRVDIKTPSPLERVGVRPSLRERYHTENFVELVFRNSDFLPLNYITPRDRVDIKTPSPLERAGVRLFYPKTQRPGHKYPSIIRSQQIIVTTYKIFYF